ncbi:MAG: glycerophosphodiester phosphodiesterase [Bacillaceae bacterium]|nr:glycerophosphodiester phosphodiesterase [Bacillaceae bacterium]
MDKTLIFAHRGASAAAPENTMIAFQKALEMGADGIELDVQLTRDRIPVVIHDEKISRTSNGTGWVKDLTFRELRTLDFGSWFSPDFRGTRIPALEDVLVWAGPTRLQINIELKNGLVPYPDMESLILELVERHQLRDRVILSSFNHDSLVRIKQFEPEANTAVLLMERLYQPWDYARSIGASGIHCYWPACDSEMIRQSQNNGIAVRPFTVNRKDVMKKLMQAGCAAIITDHPQTAFEVREKHT